MAATGSLWKPRDGPLVYLEAVTYTQNTTPNMRRSRGGPGCFTKTTKSYRPQSKKNHTDVPIRIFHGIVICPMPGMSHCFYQLGGWSRWHGITGSGALLLTEGQRSEEPLWYLHGADICYIISHRIHGAGKYANMTGVYWWDPCYHI